MKSRAAIILLSLCFATNLLAKEVFLPVSGTAGAFFSDARIFNPTDHEITIQAYYLPAGNGNNAAATPVAFTVAPRQMKIYDNIVSTLLAKPPGIGAIRFVSADDFTVEQRIYALTPANCGTSPINPCTLGQFVAGLEVTTALRKGVILGLKSGQTSPKFRTNIGAVNPNPVEAKVTWRLYDKDSTRVSTGGQITMPPYATIGPTNMTTTFFFNPGTTADITDAWVSFDSDQPIFVYGSAVDNGSTDQTYIPGSPDTGVTPPDPEPEPEPEAKTVTVTAVNWNFTVEPSATLRQNDSVKFIVKADLGTIHGFRLFSPEGQILIDLGSVGPTPIERTITLPSAGTYVYLCTRDICGDGHLDMNGQLAVSSN